MSISKFNNEGYFDPTAHKAIFKLENQANIGKRKVYVCSPFKGDINKNVGNARKYCRFVYLKGSIPIAVHLLFPQFMDDNNPNERKRAIDMGVELLSICNELWVFGTTLSEGMKMELKAALNLKIRVRFFDENYIEVEKI